MTDLSQFASLSKAQDDGIDVAVLHPRTGEDLGIVIRVAGPDSARQKKVRNAINNERLLKSRNRKPTAAELEADAVRIAAHSIIGWRGMEEGGRPVEYSPEAASDILTRYPFIFEQIADAVSDRSGFIKS